MTDDDVQALRFRIKKAMSLIDRADGAQAAADGTRDALLRLAGAELHFIGTFFDRQGRDLTKAHG